MDRIDEFELEVLEHSGVEAAEMAGEMVRQCLDMATESWAAVMGVPVELMRPGLIEAWWQW